jgi:succinate dehydrogenase / fumarate reductase flavoprotein subunit
MVTGPAIASYTQSLPRSAFDGSSTLFDQAADQEQGHFDDVLKRHQDDAKAINPWRIQQELAEVMLRDCTIERHNDRLDKVLAKIGETEDKLAKVRIWDTGHRVNQSAQFVRQLENMVVLARVIAQGARNRDESRGAHYKPEFPDRDDAKWMRTTLAQHAGKGEVTFLRSFDYSCAGETVHVTDAVDVSLVKPRERKYEKAGAASAEAASEEQG